MQSVIVVGLDGSLESRRAALWTARQASLTSSRVIVVHAIDSPVYAGYGQFTQGWIPPGLTDAQRNSIRAEVHDCWAEPLAKASVDFDVVIGEGPPAAVIREIADNEHADLIVVGRRGRGGFAELIMGSTSHQLTHHAARPLAVIP